jgi:putative holliday junction resolvase
MERILAIDFGRRRIGLALSDELGLMANGLPTLKVRNKDHAFDSVVEVIQIHMPGLIVFGLPLNLDGTRGEMVSVIEAFVEALKEVIDIQIEFIDERLTSVAAHRTMQEMGIKQKGNKGVVDRLAAVYLLEIYLQKRSTTSIE